MQTTSEHGIIFMALNASLFRQFEFVQQQWIEYGNDSRKETTRTFCSGITEGPGKS